MALGTSPKQNVAFQSKIDVPFSRYIAKQYSDRTGQKLQYYPDVLKKKPAQVYVAPPAESSAKKVIAATPEAFREKAKVEQRTTTPL